MSAAVERGVVAWIMRLNMRGTRGKGSSYVKSFYIFHGFQVVS